MSDDTEAWMSVADAAEMLGISRQSVVSYAARNYLAERITREPWGLGVRRRRWVLRSDVEAALKAKQAAMQEAGQ